MKNRIASRVVAGLTILVAAALLAGLTTYLYGALFQHARYWGPGGTIDRVQDIDVRLIRALLTRPGAGPLPDSQTAVEPLFAALDGKLAFELRRGDRIVYTNTIPERQLRAGATDIPLHDGATLTIRRYKPPAWSAEFVQWLAHPFDWSSRKYDRITAPFVAFFLIYVVFLYALAWRHRARHLSDEVLAELRRPPGSPA